MTFFVFNFFNFSVKIRLNIFNYYYINYMKNKRKVKAFFTIDPDIYEEFEKQIEEKLLDKSKLIEFLIKKYVDDNK